MRLRIQFSKTEAMRYTGHLDLYRTWERTFRRAKLPLAYSQGYRPHPRLSLACALPLGLTSQGDLLDVWLEEDIDIDSITRILTNALPPGIFVESILEIPAQSPTLQKLVQYSIYQVTILEPFMELQERMELLLEASTLIRQRQSKNYDLRPLIKDIHHMPQDEAGHQRLEMTLSTSDAGTGRPDEVIYALGGDPSATRIHRLGLILGA